MDVRASWWPMARPVGGRQQTDDTMRVLILIFVLNCAFRFRYFNVVLWSDLLTSHSWLYMFLFLSLAKQPFYLKNKPIHYSVN